MTDEKREELIDDYLHSDIKHYTNPPVHPNRFDRGRCLLLIRFLILMSIGASMFQFALLVRYYAPSYLIVIAVLLALSTLFLIGALIDLRRILRLRAEAKRK
ncbi:MAG: hypothetical protein AM325_015315 [Candidatus Thorarchaeota archaeon SMTZ1-45]